MTKRSEFQGAMLYFSATMLAAAIIVGDTQARIETLAMMVGGTGLDLSSLDFRAKALSLSGTAFDLFSEGGWMLGAAGAALLKRLQAIGLLIVTAISGEHLGGAMLVGDHVFSAEELAAMMLECAAFFVATTGLVGVMRGMGQPQPA